MRSDKGFRVRIWIIREAGRRVALKGPYIAKIAARHRAAEVVPAARCEQVGYQALINETLMAHLKQPDLESVLRRVIREELAAR